MLWKLDLNHLATRIRIIYNDCPTACNDGGISQPLLFGPLEIPRNHTMPWSTVSFTLLIKVAKSLRLQGYDALYNTRMMSTNPKYPSVFWTTSLEAVWAAENMVEHLARYPSSVSASRPRNTTCTPLVNHGVCGNIHKHRGNEKRPQLNKHVPELTWLKMALQVVHQLRVYKEWFNEMPRQRACHTVSSSSSHYLGCLKPLECMKKDHRNINSNQGKPLTYKAFQCISLCAALKGMCRHRSWQTVRKAVENLALLNPPVPEIQVNSLIVK